MAGGIVGGFAQHFELVLAMRAAEGLAAGVLQTSPRSSSCAPSRKARAGAPRASSPSAWCWRRPSARASAACWSSISAGARSSSSSCPSACGRWCWRGATCRCRRRAVPRRAGARCRWTVIGLLLAARRRGWPAQWPGASARCVVAFGGRAAGLGVLALGLFVWHETRTRDAAAADEPVPLAALRDGQRGRLHLRHGPVRLDLPGADLHADGAALSAFAGRRGAVAGRPGAGRDHPDRRAAGRPLPAVPAGGGRPGAAGGVVRADDHASARPPRCGC